MATDFTIQLQKAYEFLTTTQNPDGGWGYKRGSMSFVEPTAFVLIALCGPTGAGGQDVPQTRFQAVQRGLIWLRSQQHENGGWGINKDDTISNWMTYPTVWLFNLLYKIPELAAYYGKPEDKSLIERGRNWILTRGREPAVDATTNQQIKKLFQIESDYLGFSWGAGEAGWVIATSLALVALTVEDPAAMRKSTEVENAKNYLRDRACPDGGWNVGNPWMLGKKLPATPDATAFALVAWRECLSAEDFGPTIDVVNAGVAFLEDTLKKTNSDHTRVLATWALSLYQDTSRVDLLQRQLNIKGDEVTLKYAGKELTKTPLQGQDVNTGGWVNSPYTTAIATLALSNDHYYL